jgi:predicted MFS family arabinose efflux permease
MAMRAASMQFGYFAGSFLAGAALALGGYPAFGSLIGLIFLAAAVSIGGPRQHHPATAPLTSPC